MVKRVGHSGQYFNALNAASAWGLSMDTLGLKMIGASRECRRGRRGSVSSRNHLGAPVRVDGHLVAGDPFTGSDGSDQFLGDLSGFLGVDSSQPICGTT